MDTIKWMIDESCLLYPYFFQQRGYDGFVSLLLNWTTDYSGHASEEDELRLTGALLERLPDLQVLCCQDVYSEP